MKTPKTINLHVEGASKTRILIEGDENKAVFLNLDDQGIYDRFNALYGDMAKKADELEKDEDLAKGLGDAGTEQTEKYLAKKAEVNNYLKEKLNEIFDCDNLAEVCSAGGTMMDILHTTGKPRFEQIISDVIVLYGDAFAEGAKKQIKARERHTAKYTKKKK